MPHLGPSPSDPTPTPTPIPPLLLTQVLLRCCCSASAAWERGCGAARRSTACAGEGEESGAGCTSTVCSHVQSQPPHGLRPPRPPASIRPASAMRASAGRPPADRPASATWLVGFLAGWPATPAVLATHRWEGEREGDAAQRDGMRRRLLRAAIHGPHHAQPHRAARAAQPRHNGPASYATGGSNPGPAAVGPAGPRQGPWQGPRQGPKAGLLRTRASLPLCRQPCRVLPQQPARGMGRQAAGRRARRAARSDLARSRGQGGRRPRELHRAPTPTLAGALAEPTRPAH
jgi:hypothetical protein